MNKKIIDCLNKQVANHMVLYMKLHHFHWYVKGPQFYQLHALFQTLYEEVTEDLDLLAERILILEDKPISTLKQCLELSSIKEASGTENEQGMIQAVIQDYQMINREIMEGIDLCGEANDYVTQDIFIQLKTKLDKHNWMTTSLLR